MMNRVRAACAAAWRWLGRQQGTGRGMFARITAEKNEDRKRSEARARFWAEMRAGQREAAARSRAQS